MPCRRRSRRQSGRSRAVTLSLLQVTETAASAAASKRFDPRRDEVICLTECKNIGRTLAYPDGTCLPPRTLTAYVGLLRPASLERSSRPPGGARSVFGSAPRRAGVLARASPAEGTEYSYTVP